MAPTFSDFFASLYYENTYLPPVDLTEQEVAKQLLEAEDREAAALIQNLLGEEQVQKIFSQPLTYSLEEIRANRRILTRKGFTLLSKKTDLQTHETIEFYSVLEHPRAPNWIIKTGAIRTPKGEFLFGPKNDRGEQAYFTEEDSLLRVAMAQRIAKVADDARIKVLLPKKKFVAYTHATEPTSKYCVVCEKISTLLTAEETEEEIKKKSREEQKALAKKISTIIKNGGIVDASFNNIRLTAKGEIAFIDTEPAGLLLVSKPGLWNKFCGVRGASVEKCARIGLFTLLAKSSLEQGSSDIFYEQNAKEGLEGFHEQLKQEYEKIATPKLSQWKIALSILSLGSIFLINAIIALVKARLTAQIYTKIQKINREFKNDKKQGIDRAEEYKTKCIPLYKKYYAYVEGVPRACPSG